jgi:hypothetical protein
MLKAVSALLLFIVLMAFGEEIDDLVDDSTPDYYVFDTANDPYELIDLYDDIAIADFVEELLTRFSYFQNVDITQESQNLAGSKIAWPIAGGVVPLDNFTDHEKKTIEVGEPADGAPNVVFILLDDVGTNDLNLIQDSVSLLNTEPNCLFLAQKRDLGLIIVFPIRRGWTSLLQTSTPLQAKESF